jgi:WbqC-like protein family
VDGDAEVRVVREARVVRLAAHQPQYMPWLGYFDKMARADRFVLLDTVQYKKNEWQNRNRIRTATGWQWITVPVRYRFPMRIQDVAIDPTSPWRRKQSAALRQSYASAPYRDAILPLFDALLARPIDDLATLNVESVRLLARLFEVRTPVVLASALQGIPEGADERLIALCRALGCDTYLAGQGGHGYMDLDLWARAGVRVEFQDFRHPVYPQCHPGFEACLSAIDLLMQRGCGAGAVLRGGLARAA